MPARKPSLPMRSTQPVASILIVDDDEEMARVLAKCLERASYRVLTARGTARALAMLGSEGADLILTDLRMGEESGLDLLRRSRELAPGVPVVLITAFGDVGSYLEAMNLGAFEYLNKPVRLRDLYAVVERALRSAVGPAPAAPGA